MRVLEHRRHPRFPHEHVDEMSVLHHVREDRLDDHLAARAVGPRLHRQEDLGHPSGAQLPDETEPTQRPLVSATSELHSWPRFRRQEEP